MSRKVREIKETRGADAVRNDIRNYIRNERETMLVKWLSLEQSIKAEDRARSDFLEHKSRNDTKILPLNVKRFIGTMKRSVHKIIKHKGGSLPSIIRNMFLYWDADKSGQISSDELFACMRSLGVTVTMRQCEEIVHHYQGTSAGAVQGEMDYKELLEDVIKDEPTLTQTVEYNQDQHDSEELRFADRSDQWATVPAIVRQFIEAVQEYVNKELRENGGTPEQILRRLIKCYDYTYSGGLSPGEIQRAARRKLKLVVNMDQATAITKFYDRNNTGEIDPEAFTKDVCKDVKPILTFTELTQNEIKMAKTRLAANPFMPAPFSAPPNRILEKFKNDVRLVLHNKVKSVGGTVTSWIKEAFVKYDPGFTSKLTSTNQLIGAARKLGLSMSESDARVIMKLYDVHNTGEMHYNYLTQELTKESGDFLADAKPETDDVEAGPTARAPLTLQAAENKIKQAVESFVRVSKGMLVAKDVFHGTFMRFDPENTGRVSFTTFKAVMKELRVRGIPDQDLELFMKWFDTDGTQTLDYNSMTRQYYGASVTTEEMVLPDMRETRAYDKIVSEARARPTLSGVLPGGGAARHHAVPNHTTSKFSNTLDPAKNPFVTLNTNAIGVNSLLYPSGYGVKQSTLERNLDTIESKQVKNARLKMKRNKIIEEKRKVERKLASIEKQRKTIISDLKMRRSQSAPSQSMTQGL